MAIETVMDRTETIQTLIAQALAPVETLQTVPAGKVLFSEGTQPEGVYFIHSGEVDLSFSSPRSGEAKALLVAGSGQILGLACVVSGRIHDSSAKTRTTCVVGFIDKQAFLRLLDEMPALWLSVLQMISTNINACWDCMRNLGAAAR